MNKFFEVILSIMAGVERTFHIILPILLALIWFRLNTLNFEAGLILGIGIISTLFRAIKVGFMK